MATPCCWMAAVRPTSWHNELVGRTLQIVTNSLPVATLVQLRWRLRPGVDRWLSCIDGRESVWGLMRIRCCRILSVRRAFLSVAGINDRGCFNSNLLLGGDRAGDDAVGRRGDRVSTDSTKFGHQSLALMCDLKDVDKMVVDQDISQDWRSKILAAGVDLKVAGPTDNG